MHFINNNKNSINNNNTIFISQQSINDTAIFTKNIKTIIADTKTIPHAAEHHREHREERTLLETELILERTEEEEAVAATEVLLIIQYLLAATATVLLLQNTLYRQEGQSKPPLDTLVDSDYLLQPPKVRGVKGGAVSGSGSCSSSSSSSSLSSYRSCRC
jgi:hypothetical protein